VLYGIVAYSWWTQPQYADVGMPNNHLLEGARGVIIKTLYSNFGQNQSWAKLTQCPFLAGEARAFKPNDFRRIQPRDSP